MLCVVFEEIFDDGECPTLRERRWWWWEGDGRDREREGERGCGEREGEGGRERVW